MSFRPIVTISIVLIILISLLTIQLQNVISDEERLPLNKYYMEKRPNNSTWLVAYKPGDDDGNKTILNTKNYLNITQAIIDRKYNPEIKPEVNLNIDTHGVSGLKITIQMEFRYFQEKKLPSDADVIAYFESYTTEGRSDRPEYVSLTSTSYSETPKDVPQTDYGAMFKVSIYLEGGTEGDFIDIYCGEDGYHSYVLTPYDQPYVEDQDDNDEISLIKMTAGCYIFIAVVVIVLVVIVVGLHYKDWKNR